MWVPHNYPNESPLVRFCSFLTDKINPNLYADGNICLSLLGSWYGDGVELWNPLSSNLLQVGNFTAYLLLFDTLIINIIVIY
jgi:ubiquitin-protein ligase